MKKLIGLLLLLPISAFANVNFYGQCNYEGPSVTLEPGEYTAADLAKRGIPDNAIAAVKFEKGYVVTLHEDDGFKGRYGTLKSSDSCLENNNFNNLVSSLTIKAPEQAFGQKESILFGNSSLEAKKPANVKGQVTVYSDCNYAGLAAVLPVGDYNLAQLKKFGLANNEISSAKVPKGMSLTVFENDFLRGDSASTSGDVKCIDTGDFANRITSVSVTGGSDLAVAATAPAAKGAVTVYDQCNYTGQSASLQVGEYTNADLNALGISNNTISALQVGEGYQAELFINDFHRGDSGTLSTNNPCLIGRYNDAITSIVVRKVDGAAATAGAAKMVATVYEHCNFRGGSAELPVGRHSASALKDLRVAQDTASSIKLSPGFRATLYEGANFNGKSVVVTGDDDCLDNDDLNEKMSSIVIENSAIKAISKAQGGDFVSQPNQSSTSKSDDLVAGLTCVQQFVEKNACDERRWETMEARCQLARVEELSDGYLEGHVAAGNCNAELWDELVRRTANPHLR